MAIGSDMVVIKCRKIAGQLRTELCGPETKNKSLNIIFHQNIFEGFPGGAVVENLPANAGDTGLSPGL